MLKHVKNLVQWMSLAVFLLIVSKGKMNLWFLIFAGSLLLALLLGRIYCGWLCPMNTVMIPTEKLSKKLKLQTKNIPKPLNSNILPWIVLVFSIATMVISKRNDIQIPLLLYILILSVLITLRYEPKVFHNHICPFGALQSVAGRFARLSEGVTAEKCVGCKLCEKVCPSEAIEVTNKKADIDVKLCHQCLNCQTKCPTGAISYGKAVKGMKEYVVD